jgi:hypothetical protein
MRAFLCAWALPMGIFWGWYFLAANDVGGFFMFTREIHDRFFNTYGAATGIDPALLPILAAQACVVDTIIVLAIWAFRRRGDIISWCRGRKLRDSRRAARRYAEISSPPSA